MFSEVRELNYTKQGKSTKLNESLELKKINLLLLF